MRKQAGGVLVAYNHLIIGGIYSIIICMHHFSLAKANSDYISS